MKGWRTIAFNLFSFLAGSSVLAGVLPEKALPYIAIGTAIGNAGLRLVTDTPVGTAG